MCECHFEGNHFADNDSSEDEYEGDMMSNGSSGQEDSENESASASGDLRAVMTVDRHTDE